MPFWLKAQGRVVASGVVCVCGCVPTLCSVVLALGPRCWLRSWRKSKKWIQITNGRPPPQFLSHVGRPLLHSPPPTVPRSRRPVPPNPHDSGPCVIIWWTGRGTDMIGGPGGGIVAIWPLCDGASKRDLSPPLRRCHQKTSSHDEWPYMASSHKTSTATT
jgi:hypothetical protein